MHLKGSVLGVSYTDACILFYTELILFPFLSMEYEKKQQCDEFNINMSSNMFADCLLYK